ncbi:MULTISPECIES: hypothetical protein [Emticicia]|uniref:hypothetical protein n=1 Tax=Emticicia TaxID=312278 RepID=UPI0007D8ACD0|nr:MULTISPECIES: hypothetical protein [Emticicia]
MIEVFKTDIKNKTQANAIIKALKLRFPASDFNFDLNDCDKILRTDSNQNITSGVVEVLNSQGFICGVLEG